jgi:hypothetical protein
MTTWNIRFTEIAHLKNHYVAECELCNVAWIRPSYNFPNRWCCYLGDQEWCSVDSLEEAKQKITEHFEAISPQAFRLRYCPWRSSVKDHV